MLAFHPEFSSQKLDQSSLFKPTKQDNIIKISSACGNLATQTQTQDENCFLIHNLENVGHHIIAHKFKHVQYTHIHKHTFS